MNVIELARKQAKKLSSPKEGAGETDILDTLKKEHREVASLLKEMVESESGAQRKKLLGQIKTALVPHLRAEEKVVYHKLTALKDKQVKQDGIEGEVEHRLADRLLAQLSKIDNAASPEFSANAKVLKEMIEHHVKEEESDVWDDVKENFGEEDRYAMNAAFLSEKKKVRVS